MVGLLSDPDQLEAVRADRSLVTAAVEEALRWEAPLTGIARTAMTDAVVDGIEIKAGSSVSTLLGSANHDPSRWDDPERFDIFRQPKGHVAFATGPHLCLGIHLARMEMRAVLECPAQSPAGAAARPRRRAAGDRGVGLPGPGGPAGGVERFERLGRAGAA